MAPVTVGDSLGETVVSVDPDSVTRNVCVMVSGDDADRGDAEGRVTVSVWEVSTPRLPLIDKNAVLLTLTSCERSECVLVMVEEVVVPACTAASARKMAAT